MTDSFAGREPDIERGERDFSASAIAQASALAARNRDPELAELAVNRSMLALAADAARPVLGRLEVLCASAGKLDEFFEVRVAALQAVSRMRSAYTGADALRGDVLLNRIARDAHALVEAQYRLLRGRLLGELGSAGIRFLRHGTCTPAQAAWVEDYFVREVMPVLTPIGLDPAHPFPRVVNRSLNFAVELEGKDAYGRNSGFAVVPAPRALPRLIRLPQDVSDAPHTFMFLSSILRAHVGQLFASMTVRGCHPFRVTRDGDAPANEEGEGRASLLRQHCGNAVRLEVAAACPRRIAVFLLEHFKLGMRDLYCADGPIDLSRLASVPEWVGHPDLKSSAAPEPALQHSMRR